MARFTMHTRKNGTISFHVRDEGGYVRLDGMGANHGMSGRQICEGGCFGGQTIMADADRLEAASRRWYRAFRAAQRKYEA
jgi:hypothetical protein